MAGTPVLFKSKRVSLNPDDFGSKSDREYIREMTCTQVIDFLVDKEAKRTAHMESEFDCAVQVGFKTVSPALLAALDTVAKMKSRSRNIVTKCLAHQGVLLLNNLPGIKELNNKHTEIMLLNGSTGVLTDLIDQMDIPQYHFSAAIARPGNFVAAQHLVGECNALAEGLAVGSSTLFAVCLAWSLTMTDDPGIRGLTDKTLVPEINMFKRYVRERAILITAYWEIACLRVAELQAQTEAINVLSEEVHHGDILS